MLERAKDTMSFMRTLTVTDGSQELQYGRLVGIVFAQTALLNGKNVSV